MSPLVRGRKGHYRELFEQIRKQGYTKVRIDGEIMDIRPGMQIDRYKVHDIEVVIDRLTVTSDRRDRLGNSLQVALKMGNGMIFIQEIDSEKFIALSKHLMDPETGISYEEPSPNSFSFNSPYGACSQCKGLGRINKVDLEKVIPDNTKSINESGIIPIGETRENMIFKQLRAIAKKFKFTLSTPVKDIPQKALDIILYGGDDTFEIKLGAANHDFSYNLAYEGLTKMLERWYLNSTSERTRRWAEEFMTIDQCPICEGQRLKQESLHFKIAEKNIADLSKLDLSELSVWLGEVDGELSDRQSLIARDILKELRLRIGFLLHVGLDYLSLNRPARTLSGGESQRIRLATQIGSQLTGITYILDEPSIGLHQRDNQRLIEALKQLTEIGNTVIVVEHE